MRDLVGLSADLLHDQPENVVVGVGVLEHLTGAMFDFGVAQGRNPLAEGAVAHVVAEHGLVRGALRQTARVVEQVADRDRGRCRLIPHAEGGKVGHHGRVEIHLSLLDQLHDRQGREGLRGGGQDERRLRRHDASGSISHPEALKVHYLVVVHDAESQAGDVQVAHLLGQGRRRLRRSRDWRRVTDRRSSAQSGPCTGPP